MEGCEKGCRSTAWTGSGWNSRSDWIRGPVGEIVFSFGTKAAVDDVGQQGCSTVRAGSGTSRSFIRHRIAARMCGLGCYRTPPLVASIDLRGESSSWLKSGSRSRHRRPSEIHAVSSRRPRRSRSTVSSRRVTPGASRPPRPNRATLRGATRGHRELHTRVRVSLRTDTGEGRLPPMWCRFAGAASSSRRVHDKVRGTTDWSSHEIPFLLRPGQRLDLLKLDLVFEGPGSCWVRNIEILRTPLQ